MTIDMYNATYITEEDFDGNRPENWAEIADFLDDMIRALAADVNTYRFDYDQEVELKHLIRQVWDDYWNGEIIDAPEPIYGEGAA